MRIYRYILALVSFFAVYSCSTWQEPQIDEESIEIFIPRDSLRTDQFSQLFYWYHVEGAEKYELQIVTPSFDRIDRLILDTNVTDNKFEFTLTPGTYEWSLRAYNFSSSTGYTVRTLFIDTTTNLAIQKVLLQSPPDRDTTNLTARNFRWQSLYNADNYLFEIYQPTINGQLIHSEKATGNFLNYDVKGEGAFEWHVRAQNTSGQTGFSTRGFYVDTTAPLMPILQKPAVGVFLPPGNIDFEWTRATNTGSSVFDTLYVATDSSFTNIRRKVYSKTGKATADTLSNGIYYWGVRSFDRAGNSGTLSLSRQFTVQ